ncbi:gluconeogenesis factor YvcK family protein [Desulfogranum mediterraneum]|uniref:gluconeogenesis factor YvcK family protein n=1 Tax=Desulfogranum mediterraneum TaxID=160661 RepID=UPI001377AAB6|nr:2-phospho-L-lactate transferase CofD family protein [Desulfogranum mediterraneum]
MVEEREISGQWRQLATKKFAALDFLPGASFAEKVTALILDPVDQLQNSELAAAYLTFQEQVRTFDVSGLKVVVLGGGTGLSNIIGGDSRQQGWKENPFTGMKELFPQLHSIVCITDDGGSTGELLKDLPLIALGDLRHVLLSAVRRDLLIKRYQLDDYLVGRVIAALHAIFNYRFISCPPSAEHLLRDTGAELNDLPDGLFAVLLDLTRQLYEDPRLAVTLHRPQCLGNLLLAAAVYAELDPELEAAQLLAAHQVVRTATLKGLARLSAAMGTQRNGVLPCSTTLARLQLLYENGVLVTSEFKSSHARRGYAVDKVLVEFSRHPFLQPEVGQLLSAADVIVLAPGSLYTSIIPILQIPGLADAIRANTRALKLLVANIWVQKGETDAAFEAPDRKFHVSDLIRAYHRNIPGGVDELFSTVLCLKMEDIPGSVLQRYALEEKEPIYLDRAKVEGLGFRTVAARIFSEEQLLRRGVIQHDPKALARAIKTLWTLQAAGLVEEVPALTSLPPADFSSRVHYPERQIPCLRYQRIQDLLHYTSTELISGGSTLPKKMDETQRRWLLERLVEIIWLHPDILFEHLKFFRGITLIAPENWKRSQQWDNVFSFYDPADCKIKIRQDQSENLNRFEAVFLIALGQSLLGNYACSKQMVTLRHGGEDVGRMYQLSLREPQQLQSFLTPVQLTTYLQLCRMNPSHRLERLFSRVINSGEGFTPPGLHFGLFYAWYLDNRFAPNIDYTMSIMKNDLSDFIPEQIRIMTNRRAMITFFREQVFGQQFSAAVTQNGAGGI